MEKHLILLDLDGTLLNNESKISDLNKEVLTKLREQGHVVNIVTGRAHYRSHMFYEDLALDSVFVNRNGAHIHHPKDESYKELIQCISKTSINQIFKGPIVNYIDRLYYEHKNTIYVVKGHRDFYKYELCELKDSDIFIDDEINLISMFILRDKVEEVKTFLNTIEDVYIEVFNANEEFPTALFQIYPNCNKANSIKVLSDFYSIPLSNVIAFGDGSNDIEMIRNAKIGIAMGNAIEEVKQVAKIVLEETNDDSAVGKFLIKYFDLK